MRTNNTNTVAVTVPSGGVHFEASLNRYRGSVTVNRVCYRTARFATRIGALRALNRLRRELIKTLNASNSSSMRSSSSRTSRSSR